MSLGFSTWMVPAGQSQTSPEKAFRGTKHLLTRYLGDFGCLGIVLMVEQQKCLNNSSR